MPDGVYLGMAAVRLRLEVVVRPLAQLPPRVVVRGGSTHHLHFFSLAEQKLLARHHRCGEIALPQLVHVLVFIMFRAQQGTTGCGAPCVKPQRGTPTSRMVVPLCRTVRAILTFTAALRIC